MTAAAKPPAAQPFTETEAAIVQALTAAGKPMERWRLTNAVCASLRWLPNTEAEHRDVTSKIRKALSALLLRGTVEVADRMWGLSAPVEPPAAQQAPAPAEPLTLDRLLHRILAGLEVLLVEPERAQEIARDLHDDVAEASCWAPALTEDPTPAARVQMFADLAAGIPDVRHRSVTLFMKSPAALEKLAGDLGIRVSRRISQTTGTLNIVHEAAATGICLFASVPATVEDLAALLPKSDNDARRLLEGQGV